MEHCVKSVQIRNIVWSVFSRIRTEYRKIRTRKNSVFRHFSRSLGVCYLCLTKVKYKKKGLQDTQAISPTWFSISFDGEKLFSSHIIKHSWMKVLRLKLNLWSLIQLAPVSPETKKNRVKWQQLHQIYYCDLFFVISKVVGSIL